MTGRRVTLGHRETGAIRLTDEVSRADLESIAARAANMLDEAVTELVCDVRGVDRPTVVTVEAICRLRLSARRHGLTVRLRGASVELLDLLGLCGIPPGSVLEDERDAEQREEARGVQEERDPRDPVA
jgi:STAS domain